MDNDRRIDDLFQQVEVGGIPRLLIGRKDPVRLCLSQSGYAPRLARKPTCPCRQNPKQENATDSRVHSSHDSLLVLRQNAAGRTGCQPHP